MCDCSHFRHILNFLRTGCILTLPEGQIAKEELAVEADFYGLEALVKAIRMPKIDIASSCHLKLKASGTRSPNCERPLSTGLPRDSLISFVVLCLCVPMVATNLSCP